VTEKEELHRLVDKLAPGQITALLSELSTRYPAGMPDELGEHDVTLTLTPTEFRIVHAALRSYLEIFGHDEKEVSAAIRAAVAKLTAAQGS
jgi:hypothetical protein